MPIDASHEIHIPMDRQQMFLDIRDRGLSYAHSYAFGIISYLASCDSLSDSAKVLEIQSLAQDLQRVFEQVEDCVACVICGSTKSNVA